MKIVAENQYIIPVGHHVDFELNTTPPQKGYVRYTGVVGKGIHRIEYCLLQNARIEKADFSKGQRAVRVNLYLYYQMPYCLRLDVIEATETELTFVNQTPDNVGRFE